MVSYHIIPFHVESMVAFDENSNKAENVIYGFYYVVSSGQWPFKQDKLRL